MGLTRVAEDPWVEGYTVPRFEKAPIEVCSYHQPLTPERAVAVVQNHLDRISQSAAAIQEQNSQVEVAPEEAPEEAPVLAPSPTAAGTPQPPQRSNSLLPTIFSVGTPWSDGHTTHFVSVSRRQPQPDASSPGPDGHSGPSSPGSGAAGTAGCSGIVDEEQAPPAQLLRSIARSATLTRRLSCPEHLGQLGQLLQDANGSGSGDVSGHYSGPNADGDALEPLANHHAWAANRSPGAQVASGNRVLYCAASVLEQQGGARSQARFTLDLYDPHGAFRSGGAGAPRGRLARAIAEGASRDQIRTLAAVIIQSYCRGWRARREAAARRAARARVGADAAQALADARAAAEAMARDRAEVRRQLRSAARDCLLALQAQADYDRTRVRLAAGRGLGPGAAAAAPPPPPVIPPALWTRCVELGHDPIQVLLDGGLKSRQIEDIIAASQLAAALPRRAAATAARLGVHPAVAAAAASAPEDGARGRGSEGGAAVAGAAASLAPGPRLSQPGSGGGSSRASLSGTAMQVEHLRHGAAPQPHPYAHAPLQHMSNGPMGQPAIASYLHTTELVDQLLAQQQQQHGGMSQAGGPNPTHGSAGRKAFQPRAAGGPLPGSPFRTGGGALAPAPSAPAPGGAGLRGLPANVAAQLASMQAQLGAAAAPLDRFGLPPSGPGAPRVPGAGLSRRRMSDFVGHPGMQGGGGGGGGGAAERHWGLHPGLGPTASLTSLAAVGQAAQLGPASPPPPRARSFNIGPPLGAAEAAGAPPGPPSPRRLSLPSIAAQGRAASASAEQPQALVVAASAAEAGAMEVPTLASPLPASCTAAGAMAPATAAMAPSAAAMAALLATKGGGAVKGPGSPARMQAPGSPDPAASSPALATSPLTRRHSYMGPAPPLATAAATVLPAASSPLAGTGAPLFAGGLGARCMVAHSKSGDLTAGPSATAAATLARSRVAVPTSGAAAASSGASRSFTQGMGAGLAPLASSGQLPPLSAFATATAPGGAYGGGGGGGSGASSGAASPSPVGSPYSPSVPAPMSLCAADPLAVRARRGSSLGPALAAAAAAAATALPPSPPRSAAPAALSLAARRLYGGQPQQPAGSSNLGGVVGRPAAPAMAGPV